MNRRRMKNESELDYLEQNVAVLREHIHEQGKITDSDYLNLLFLNQRISELDKDVLMRVYKKRGLVK